MKKILYSIILALFVLFPVSVSAEGYVSASTSSLTIEQGTYKTFTITAYNTIGDVYINSNNSGVASVSTGMWGTGMVDEKQTKSGTVTVTGNSVGTTTITLSIDAATFDNEDLSGQTRTITVNVIPRTSSGGNGGGYTPSNNNNVNNNSNNNNSNNNSNLSTNNKLSSLTVDGHELKKVDDNNYELTVSNNVTSINVNGKAEDEKATITGTGAKELVVGENVIEVVVTSESGATNVVKIKVIRKDAYYLEDLKTVLNDSSITKANIKLKSDSVISKEDLENIKKSKKTVSFNVYDDNNKLLYSWIVNGKEITNTNEFNTNVKFTSDYIKEIKKASNYAEGLYITFGHNGKLPKGTKIKLLVSDKFSDGDKINLYSYNKDKINLRLVEQKLTVKDGYIEFDAKDYSDCFITMSSIGAKISNTTSNINVFMIISIVELIILIIVLILDYLKKNPIANLKKDNQTTNQDVYH